MGPSEKKATQNSEVKVKRLKPRLKKKKSSHRKVEINCPYCYSKLRVNDVGVLECSGDKLKIWENEFIKYVKLGADEKKAYLDKLHNDYSLFLELFERWERSDTESKRLRLECIYTNQIFNPVSRYRTSLPDPILVAAIEESLGRELTEEEKFGESEIWREGRAYFTNFKEGRVKVRIPILIYPDSFI